MLERLTPSAFPFVSVNLSGGLTAAELYDYAFFVMRPEKSRVAGVGNVEVLSSDTREIEVIVEPAKLTAAGLTIGDLADALKASNQLQPVGRYPAAGLQHLVLASGLWKSIDDIPPTPVVVKGGSTIRVADIAKVQSGAPDRTMLISGGGLVAANISVSQQIGANILEVRAGVERALQDLSHSLPAGLRMSKTYNLAEFVSTAIANVRDAILVGAVLAVIVLLLFLRDWRLTLVASVTLPLTVMTTFLVMRWLGETINVMSMGGLAVAIGLVIDDAVVVVEGIYRHLDNGSRPARRCSGDARTDRSGGRVDAHHSRRVGSLGMLSGVVGQFFRALSITLASAVLISLVQALTLIPCSRGLRRGVARRRQSRCITPGDGWNGPTHADSTRRCGVRSRDRAGERACRRGSRVVQGRRDRVPAGSGRGRVRHRLPDAGGERTRGDRPNPSQDGERAPAHTGHCRVHAPHGIRTRPVRHAAEQRRHPRPPQAAAIVVIRRGHQRPARQAGGSARGRDRIHQSCRT